MSESPQPAVDPGRILYVTDLDGTLLGPDARLSENSRLILERLIDSGVLITCATGRSWTSTQAMLGTLRFRLPMILHTGTFTYDSTTDTMLDAHSIDARTVAVILAASRRNAVAPLVFRLDGDVEKVHWPIEAENLGVRAFWDDRAHDPRNSPVATWAELPTSAVFSICALGSEAAMIALRDEVDSLDIAAPGVSKALALSQLAERVRATRLVVFGDNLNDLPMFELADESYAVSNAVDAVLAAATGVIGTNDDDGVARWLETHAVAPWQSL